MSGDNEGDLSAIAWPGFVDILSAVIIMFVFFVLIIAVVLYFHVVTYKSKVKADAVDLAMDAVSEIHDEQRRKQEKDKQEKASKAKDSQDVSTEELQEQIENLQKKNEVLEQVVSDMERLLQARSDFEESEKQSYGVEIDANRFVIFFGIDAITLTQETLTAMKEFLESMAQKHNMSKASAFIKGGVDLNSGRIVSAKKLAVARMLNSRNVLLRTDISKSNIKIKIDSDREIQEEYHWVEVVIEPGQ